MTKERFLRAIQEEAHWGNGKLVWADAIKRDENDIRFTYLDDTDNSPNELIRRYGKYFGLELKAAAPRRKIDKEKMLLEEAKWYEEVLAKRNGGQGK